VGLPGRFSVVMAAPQPFRRFRMTLHLFAFGLERPIVQRGDLTTRARAMEVELAGIRPGRVHKGVPPPVRLTCASTRVPLQSDEARGGSRRMSLGSEARKTNFNSLTGFQPYRSQSAMWPVGGNFINGGLYVHALLEDGVGPHAILEPWRKIFRERRCQLLISKAGRFRSKPML
jgi:hypothetical protein